MKKNTGGDYIRVCCHETDEYESAESQGAWLTVDMKYINAE